MDEFLIVCGTIVGFLLIIFVGIAVFGGFDSNLAYVNESYDHKIEVKITMALRPDPVIRNFINTNDANAFVALVNSN
jgi:hypothetical protein